MNKLSSSLSGTLDHERTSRPAEEGGGEIIDLRAIWSAMVRHLYPAIAILAVALLLGIASILLSSKIYQATSTVQIEQQSAKVLGTEELDPVVSGADAERFIQTQVDILRSRSLAAKVADDLALSTVEDFFYKMNGDEPDSGNQTDRDNAIIDTLLDNMSAIPPLDSRVVSINVRSIDPVLAARIANSFADNFILNNIERKYSSSDYSRQFLQNELAKAQNKLEQSERNLISYARTAGLIDIPSGNDSNSPVGGAIGQSLVTSNLVQLNSDYARAQSAKIAAQNRWQSAAALPLFSIPEVLEDPTIQELSQQKAELTGELAEMRERLKPDHPSFVRKSAQIAEINSELTKQAQNIKAAIRSNYTTAAKVESDLNSQISGFKASALDERDRGVRYNILKREVDTNRQLYDSLLQRFKEISAESGVTANNVSIVDRAEIPREPVLPRPAINMALALVLGACFAGGYIFMREHFDDAIRNPGDLEEKLGIRLLGVVPMITESEPAVALQDRRSTLSEAYATIRSSVDLLSGNGAPSTILVTSSRMAEGKSTTSFALANKFAESGRRTLIIDGDMRKPSMHRLFGRKRSDTGLSTVLAGQSDLFESVLNTEIANLDYLPSGALPPDPTLLLSGERLRGMFTHLTAKYEVIVIDGPPVLALADATQLASNIEATIFVTETGGSHFGQLKHAVQRLADAHANIIGGVITKFDRKSARYGSEMDYYYSYSYKTSPDSE